MLYYIVNAISDDNFAKYINYVKDVYFPEEKYKTAENMKMLPDWDFESLPSEDEMISETDEALKKITEKICNDPIYPLMNNNGEIERYIKFPYISRFHRYFLIRRWNQPERDPQDKIEDLVRLYPSTSISRDKRGNYSKNHGNFNHFVNVVAAMARLIMYFKDSNKIRELFEPKSTNQQIKNTMKNWA